MVVGDVPFMSGDSRIKGCGKFCNLAYLASRSEAGNNLLSTERVVIQKDLTSRFGV
jgi:hypothetical protein